MAKAHYGPPFRLWLVRDPRGKPRQFADEKAAKAEALRVAKATGEPLEKVLRPSRTLYAKLYRPGRPSARVNTYCETSYEAKQWTRGRERKGQGPARVSKTTLKGAIEDWLRELKIKGRSAKTLLDYECQTAFWVNFFGESAMPSDVTHEGLLDFFEDRQTIVSPKGRKREASARLLNLNRTLWKAFAKWALAQELIDDDPTTRIESWRVPEKEPVVFSVEELRTLLEKTQQDATVEGIMDKRNVGGPTGGASKEAEKPWSQTIPKRKYLYAIVVLGISTLLRKSNVIGLRWGQVDLHRGELRIDAAETKTRSEVCIPLGRAARNALAELTKGAAEDRVFGALVDFRKSFGSALSRAGIRRGSFHSLRKSSLTILREKGVSYEVVAKLGGWSVKGDVMLSHYRRVAWEELQKAVAVLDDVILGESKAASGRERAKEAH